MKKNDIIFAVICGLSVAWIGADFFKDYTLIIFLTLPVLSVAGLLLCDIWGRRVILIRQAGKFVLAGAFADVIDIKVFQFLFLFAPFSLIFKGISFLIATVIKFLFNKHWTFEKPGKDGMGEEAVQFFLVTLVGLGLDVASFYCFSRIETVIPTGLWVELSIIFAAIIAAVWNFLGYKFLVFKK